METSPIIIICALDLEAKPLVEYFKLSRQSRIFSHKVFSGKDISLIVSGLGKIKAAAAVSKILAYHEESRLVNKAQIINIGTAASCDVQVGELRLINKINSTNNNSCFYPEMYLKTNIVEAEVTTLDEPLVAAATKSYIGLFDMEAQAIFEAALLFLPIQNLHFLKIVSDNGSSDFLKKEYIANLFKAKLGYIDEYIENLRNHIKNTSPLLNSEQYRKLKLIIEEKRFSQTQFSELEKQIERFLLRGGSFEKLLEKLKSRVSDKKERNILLKDLVEYCLHV